MSLLGKDTGDPALYTDATLAEPALVTLRDRVQVKPTEELTGTQTRLVAQTQSGVLETFVDTGIPAVDLSDQSERLDAKFRVLAARRLGEDRTDGLAGAVASIEETGVLADLLRLACNA